MRRTTSHLLGLVTGTMACGARNGSCSSDPRWVDCPACLSVACPDSELPPDWRQFPPQAVAALRRQTGAAVLYCELSRCLRLDLAETTAELSRATAELAEGGASEPL